jgi:hypothetical protein
MSAGVLMSESATRLKVWPREDARSRDASRTIRHAAIAMWRYLSDTVPWLVMLAIMALAAMPSASRTLRDPAIASGAFLLMVSIVIHAHGAYSFETLQWNDKRPLPEVMLDWSQPQFLAGWIDER